MGSQEQQKAKKEEAAREKEAEAAAQAEREAAKQAAKDKGGAAKKQVQILTADFRRLIASKAHATSL